MARPNKSFDRVKPQKAVRLGGLSFYFRCLDNGRGGAARESRKSLIFFWDRMMTRKNPPAFPPTGPFIDPRKGQASAVRRLVSLDSFREAVFL